MRLKSFLLTESFFKNILEEDFFKHAKQNCKKSIVADPIYRGDASIKFKYNYYDKGARKSRRSNYAHNNYYMELFTKLLPKWKEYPDRSKSLICSTSFEDAKGWGAPQLILPFDGSKIGICPTADIWWSFNSSDEFFNTGISDLNSLAIILENLFGKHLNASSLESKLKSTKFDAITNTPAFAYKSLDSNVARKLDRYILNNASKTLWEFVEKALDPNKAGFKCTTSYNSLPYGVEVFTDGTCLGVYVEDEEEAYNIKGMIS